MISEEIQLPNYEEILNLERNSNKHGSGISYQELIGRWKFKYVWKKGVDKVDNISSSLLQVFSANLELNYMDSETNISSLKINNSIKFGLISIVFSGKAVLKGNRPLLSFNFKNLSLKVGNLDLLNKSFKEIDSKEMPFFSLISIDRQKKWLCARGKGGSIAIWINNDF